MSEKLTKLREALIKLDEAQDALRVARDCFKTVKVQKDKNNFQFDAVEYQRLDAHYEFMDDTLRAVEQILEHEESVIVALYVHLQKVGDDHAN